MAESYIYCPFTSQRKVISSRYVYPILDTLAWGMRYKTRQILEGRGTEMVPLFLKNSRYLDFLPLTGVVVSYPYNPQGIRWNTVYCYYSEETNFKLFDIFRKFRYNSPVRGVSVGDPVGLIQVYSYSIEGEYA